MSQLFSPLTVRALEVRNRVWMSPMCMYSADPEGENQGAVTPFHQQHLASRAAGGAGLILLEATSVNPQGRISPWDLGLWNDTQVAAVAPVLQLCRSLGAATGVQLAHAGRKASTMPPWTGQAVAGEDQHGWTPLAPSAQAFGPASVVPTALDTAGIEAVVQDFRAAARRAVQAGFDVIEIHGAHGYLLHQFCSPLANQRTDEWGGSFDNRIRLPLAVVEAVRAEVGADLPVFYRMSATDWYAERGLGGPSWTVEEAVALAVRLAECGVDLIDVSTGGVSPDSHPESPGPGYQVDHARAVKEAVTIPVSSVGLIVGARQAEDIVAGGHADAVMVGRELLRDPYTPARWQAELDGGPDHFPVQYQRGLPYRFS